ncbi:MAG: YggS family pyridoxal phosphate-dependent enzyme [Planctomycetes bacterium]|nr:YggS family pyridoxal phosphate-dependent enzyme [Planctomycetota bacterium]
MASTLESNLLAVRERLARAAVRSGRDPARVRLVAVTKSVDAARAADLARLGVLDLGESRADALRAKSDALQELSPPVRWHFLGHLQRNKARRVVERADALHSVDSAALLAALARLQAELGRAPELYLQLKLADEPDKTGLAPAELPAVLDLARSSPGLRLAGLMAIAPLVADPEAKRAAARRVFRELAAHARALEARTDDARLFVDGRVRLSMGMTDDFEVAVEEGADVVRVGSALFAGLEADAGGRHAA